MNMGFRLIILTTVSALSLRAADRNWIAAGDGSWSNTASWSGGVLPGASDTALFNNALLSDSTVIMDGAAPLVGKIKVDNLDSSTVRVFTGSQTVRSNEFVKGRTELRGTWLSTYKAITGVGGASGQTAWLTLSPGALFSATNGHALYLGNANNALGRVTVRAGARLTLSEVDTDFGISIGRNTGSVGSFIQEGGVVSSVGRFMPGYYGYGVYELRGGVLDLPYGTDVNTRYRLAVQAGSTGLMYQRGGDLYVSTNSAGSTYQFEIESGNNNASGIYYADGGVSHFGYQVKLISGSGANSNPSYGELTVDRAGVVEVADTLYLRSPTVTYAKGVSAANINRGGTLRVANITRGSSGPSFLNGNGGVLEMANAGELTALFATIGSVTLYEGGLELRHAAASGGTRITGTLRGPGGWGVSSVAVTGGGSGYLAPPLVTFAGGSGSNATAVAFVDDNGAVTGVVVTCRGEGYGESDAVMASFSGGGGSGGSAVVALAQNRTGPLVKTGDARLVTYAQPIYDGDYVVREGLFLQSTDSDGAQNLAAVRVSGVGSRFQNGSGTASANTSDKWDLINPLAKLYLGGDWGGGELMLPCGAADTVYQQHYSAVELGFGRSQLTTVAQTATNGAALTFASASRRPGASLTLTTTTNLAVVVSGDASAIAFGSVRPVVPGVSIGDVTTLTTLDSGRLVLLDADDSGFGEGSNFWVQASAVAVGLAVNSLRLDDAKSLTLQDVGTTVIGSGMVVARSGSAGGTSVSGGTLTTGNGVDLILSDFHNGIERRNVSGGKTGLVADTRVTDNGTIPVALFALGRTWDAATQSIATGPAVALTSATNTYSGGTFILDTALAVAGDGSLGRVPAQPTNNVFTSGMAMLRAPAENVTVSLHSNRNIRVCGGGLTFLGDTGSQAGRVLFDVAGDISGEGVLVMNHWAGGGVRSVVQLDGDNRGFEGSLAVHGMLRLTGAYSLPPQANLLLCGRGDVNTGGGVLEMAGAFTRALGSGAGQVRWGEVNDVAPGYASNNSGAYGGGFSAYGGPLTVNVGGDRRTLTLNKNGFAPARLRLQDDYASDELVWENPVDVTNNTLLVQVAYLSTSKAVWRGAVSSSSYAGDGGFTKTGNGKLVLADGADFGPIAFAANNTVELQVTNCQTLACNMSGSGMNLVKYGSGIAYLSGSNSYANVTHIYAGALFVNGTNTSGGNVIVEVGAVLGGGGMVAPKAGASVTVEGSLEPGADVGICGALTVGSAEQASSLNLNGVLALDLTSEACDRVEVLGDVSVAETAVLSLTATDESLWQTRRGDQIPVLTWTGSLVGPLPSAVPELPNGWKARLDSDAKIMYLSYASPGTVIGLK